MSVPHNHVPAPRTERTAGRTAAPPTPNTPRSRNGAGLNSVIHSLEHKWNLGLEPRDDNWSPEKNSDSLGNKVYGQLKRLHYAPDTSLQRALDTFQQVALGTRPEKRLQELHRILKSNIIQTPTSKNVTPVSLNRAQNQPQKSLKPLHLPQGGGATNSKSPTKTTTTATATATGQSIGLKTTSGNAFDPGSPTDEDEDDFFTPPSPSLSLSSRSAQRRVQASSRFCQDKKAIKRPFDGFGASGRSSPKLTKTFKDQQPSGWPPASKLNESPSTLLKQYSLDRSRSFQTDSTKTSFNDSFRAESSIQSTQAVTTNTSFTSDANDGDVRYPILPEKRPTTTGYLDGPALSHINSRLGEGGESLPGKKPQPPQLSGRESSSTFGSIDEDGLLETSNRAGRDYARSARLPSMSPPQTLGSRQGYGTSWSAGKNGSTRHKETRDQPPVTNLHPRPDIKTQPMVRNTKFSTSPNKDNQTLVPWYIREIPSQNLFVEDLPKELENFPYFILFICCRLAIENKISMKELVSDVHHVNSRFDPEAFWRNIESKTPNSKARDPHKVWTAIKKDFDGFVFKGIVALNPKRKGPVFRLGLLPISADRSCRLERKFGSHRFLYLNMISFESTKPERFNEQEWQYVQRQWNDWLTREHTFLGRKWRVFHVETIKKKSNRIRDDCDKRIVMFATEGWDIEPISIGEMLNWFIDFNGNKEQSFCKAYARLDLGLSRTISTLTFKPSQIIRVGDKLADGSAEDATFNDLPLFFIDQKSKKRAIMNDGCSRMSVGAALEIWRMYRKATDFKEGLPSILQGRIGGAKGVWMICGEPSTTNPNELAIWIEVTNSQLKFEPHDEDRDELNYDRHRLTFEYLNHSSRPTPSALHKSFIPILVDRGVSQDVIARLAKDRLDIDRENLQGMLSDSEKLYHWLHQQSPPEKELVWEAALPKSLPNKIRCLLQNGFHPADEPYLAEQLCKYVKLQHLRMEQKLKIPLGRAAYLFGVADPLGVLAPGEVHVHFSEPFVDEATIRTFRALNNIDLLVARQPACRRSDIQKVRAVKKPELDHLVDVVVFPSRGEYPMAGKLQGGDYDGDIFWLCWEPDLTGPFKNAPAPLDPPEPTKYGIRVDSRKLHEVMNPQDLSTAGNFIQEALEFRLMPSLLGLVTNFHEKQAYKENQIFSWRLDALCDTHDLLVDGPKQGFMFNKSEYTELVECKLKCGNPAVPAYKQAMEACKNKIDIDETEDPRGKDYRHKTENILDFLYFQVVRQHNVATLQMVKESFQKTDCDDKALRYPCLNLNNSQSNEIQTAIRAELASLATIFNDLHRLWIKLNREEKRNFSDVLDACYSQYQAIVPTTPTIEPFKPLFEPYLSPNFNMWELIRASALYSAHGLPKDQSFVWHMAGRDLMKLKGSSIPGSTYITPSILSNMKPRPIKVPRPKEEEEDEEERKEQESQSNFLEMGL
ncbi:hypothetical protein DM02DRAFT_619483 [Periconia macrospinosa]|uniref:RNA-dependent RNA polymerase n=1 Tax=Periconia macrospinosa TaxID=97972 RepID=A0A2V1D5A4_9PLEO|nr:hypothetical protein DM02DRAFT_619483 [Periconia macrospinosa]